MRTMLWDRTYTHTHTHTHTHRQTDNTACCLLSKQIAIKATPINSRTHTQAIGDSVGVVPNDQRRLRGTRSVCLPTLRLKRQNNRGNVGGDNVASCPAITLAARASDPTSHQGFK